jgi:hypothetical protein
LQDERLTSSEKQLFLGSETQADHNLIQV